MADNKDEDIMTQLYEEEDEDLSQALDEYIDSIENQDYKTQLMSFINSEEDAAKKLSNSISEMALLISSAAVLRDEEDYLKLKKKILFSSRQDSEHIKNLRLHYLNNRNAIDIEAILDSEDEKKEYHTRMNEFFSDYKNQHGIN